MTTSPITQQLEQLIVALKDEANAIQARADAEQRDLTVVEQREVEGLFRFFDAIETEHARRTRTAGLVADMQRRGAGAGQGGGRSSAGGG